MTIIGEALESVWEAITGWFNFDTQKFAKSVLPGWLYDWFYDEVPPKGTGKEQVEPSKTAAKPPSAVLTEGDVDKIMNAIDFRLFDFGSMFGFDLNFGQNLKDTLTETMKGGIPGMAIQKAAEGGLIGMSPFPKRTTDALGLESGGLFTLSKGEFVLDNQAAGMFLQAAQLLSGSNQGQELIEGQRAGNALAGATIAPTVVNSSSVVNAPSTSSMMLPTADPNPYNMDFNPESRLFPA